MSLLENIKEPLASDVIAASPEGKFIVEYLGTAMMDSRCSYTSQMMPWVIAEILRFSGITKVVLSVKDCRLTCTSLKQGNVIFDSHTTDCLYMFPVVTSGSLPESPSLLDPGSAFKQNQYQSSSKSNLFSGNNYGNCLDDKKCFVMIIRANNIYLHCRLFSASSEAQVSEVFSTMKESSKSSATASGVNGSGINGPIRSSSNSKVNELSPISPDSISFEVLYVGKLRMSYRKAPTSFIDEALNRFRSHENDKVILERRDSVMDGDSRRSSSQESSSDVGGSCESLGFSKPAINVMISSPSDQTDRDRTPVSEESTSNEYGPYKGQEFIKETSPLLPSPTPSESREIVDSKVFKAIVKSSIPHPLEDVTYPQAQRSRNPSGDACLVKSMSLPVEPMRNRALSTGNYPREQVLETNRIGNSHYNRTMILIVGRCEMKIISPDAKTLLFAKHFRDIFQSAQGIQNKEYFGFICREAPPVPGSSHHHGGGGYVAYVFRCQSESVASDILKVLKQAYAVTQENLSKERQIQSCDHCPMVWYRQLCAEIDGLSCDERIQIVILKHINGLLDEDRQSIMQKFHGAEPQTIQEQNELLMMLLRVHCESKQVKHIHDTTENRHEFLNQFLGGGEIFTKARRSITNSFDQFIKRKSRDGPIRELSLPHHMLQNQSYGKESPLLGGGQTGGCNTGTLSTLDSPGEGSDEGRNSRDRESCSMVVSDSPLDSTAHQHRPRSSTLGALSGDKIRYEIRNRRTSQASQQILSPLPPLASAGSSSALTPRSNSNAPSSPSQSQTSMQKNSPMMNLFQKVGSQSKPAPQTSSSMRRSGSWRHAIFKKVVSPGTPTSGGPSNRVYHSSSTPTSSRTFRPKRTSEELRQLWKTAINQQIILIRMEKQNLRLKAKQQEADVKRIKLSYKDLGICDEEANDTWDLIISQAQMNPNTRCDIQLLNSALLRGIPKHKRGQIWQFFIQQRSVGNEPNYSNFCHLNLQTTYDQLLRQLTSQQHAILIDLGRTFPTHSYFSSALGSGQLALFNILKAYSLLDTDVGYCQGLSFVAGLLLMHLEEEEAFSVLKYIMFDLGAREHYKPDMHELQVKLYQLTRLIHDQDADLLLLLNHYDVLPSLYAAPWFLTLFASQFSVGFAVRVLDVLLLHGVDVIAKFAVVIILDHKKELMQCTGLEQVMECFKNVVTNISSEKLDRYLRKVLESDWDKQMLTYAVEYSVMNDEAFHAFLTESSMPQGSSSVGKGKPSSDKSVQTDPIKSSSPVTTAEKHPILGDLIQRQNAEISKLKLEKADLRKDVQNLLSCMVTMQKLAQISSSGRLSLPVPPEVTGIASKYFMKCGTSYVGLLENGWNQIQGQQGMSYSKSDSAGVLKSGSDSKLCNTNSNSNCADNNKSTNYSLSGQEISDRSNINLSSSQSSGIPPLDLDSSDDSSDAGSHPSSVDSPTDPNIRSCRSAPTKVDVMMTM